MNTILKSNIDQSVNFIEESLVGFIEARYVRKVDDYFIAYLSSQTGCNRGCRFCHLTATGQTKFEDVSTSDFIFQALQIFKEYKKSDSPAKYVHFNFMARGEPLNNEAILKDADEILFALGNISKDHNLFPKFNISTIMPRDIPPLTDIFRTITPTIYYSIYSMDETFRRKWMPNAMEPNEALRMLKEYQDLSKKIIKFHGCFIKGENDSASDVVNMMIAIKDHNITGEFNIVHYNPYSIDQGEESERLEATQYLISQYMPCKLIPRVGFDVKASCGMFVQEKE